MTVDGERARDRPAADRSRTARRVLALNRGLPHDVPDTGSLIVTTGRGALFPRGIRSVESWCIDEQERSRCREEAHRASSPAGEPGSQMAHVLVLGAPDAGGGSAGTWPASWGVRLAERSADTIARYGGARRGPASSRPAARAGGPAPPPAAARASGAARSPPGFPGSPSSPVTRMQGGRERHRAGPREWDDGRGVAVAFAGAVIGLVVLHFVLGMGLSCACSRPTCWWSRRCSRRAEDARGRRRPRWASRWGSWRCRPRPTLFGAELVGAAVLGFLGSCSRDVGWPAQCPVIPCAAFHLFRWANAALPQLLYLVCGVRAGGWAMTLASRPRSRRLYAAAVGLAPRRCIQALARGARVTR